MNLFNRLVTPDRTKTIAAYNAKYMPIDSIDDTAKSLIVWERKVMLYKGQIEQVISDDLNSIRWQSNPRQRSIDWTIHWKYNAVPTEIEWARKSSKFIIECSFRVIKDIGAIVVFSF